MKLRTRFCECDSERMSSTFDQIDHESLSATEAVACSQMETEIACCALRQAQAPWKLKVLQ